MHPPVYDRLIVAFEYAAPGDALVRQFKSARHFVLAPMLASLLANAVRNAAPVPSRNTIVVPVPASCAGIVHRGFNPAAEIARYLARQLGMRYRPGLLRRVREAPRQASLPRAERMRSVLSLYDCPQRVDGLDIAVVDDVITTGSTLNSIARVLKDAGAASVCAVVLARTPRD